MVGFWSPDCFGASGIEVFFIREKSGSVLLIRQLREMLEMEAAKRSLKGVC